MGYKKHAYLVFGILGLSYVLVFFHRLSPAVMALDIMQEFGAGGALMGILASAYFYPYSIMQIPAGLLSDGWGPRRSVTVFLLIAAAGSIIFGLSNTAGVAIVSRAVVGLGVALVFVPTMKILTNWFEEEQYIRMTGIMMSLGGVGAYTAATPLALLSEALTWRGSMITIGVVTIAVAAAAWLIVRDTPQELGYPPVKKVTHRESETSATGLWAGLAMVLRSARFWPMAACFFFSAAVSLTILGLWGGPFLMHVYGMSRPQAGAVLSMMALGLIIGAPIMSWISQHLFRSQKAMMVTNLGLIAFLFAFLAFFTGSFSTGQLYAWCFIYNFLGSGTIVVGYTIIKENFPIEMAGTATGLVNIFPFAGAAVGQPLMGWYLDLYGNTGGVYPLEAYSAAFKFCLLSILIAFAAAFLVTERQA